jgi:hypothetical protein
MGSDRTREVGSYLKILEIGPWGNIQVDAGHASAVAIPDFHASIEEGRDDPRGGK